MTLRFGTDGVRGVANEELSPEFVMALGRAIVRTLGVDRPFLLGRDTRRSGTMLEAALAAGMAAEGAHVEAAGPIPTPGLAWLADERDCPAAMVTASHNPFADNGVKVFGRGGRKLDDATEQAIEAALEDVLDGGVGDGAPIGAAVGVATRVAGAVDRYIVQLIDAISTRLDGQRIVLDCANGATFGAAPRVFAELGADVTAINVRPDGTNINAHCGATDPTELIHEVKRTGARAGFAFDGDGDRVIAVDEHGVIVDGDALMGMHALDLASRGALSGSAIAVTVMSNLGLRRTLAGADIAIIETPVGDRNILDALDAHGLALGGEQSGHIVFAAASPTGDGILTALRTAELMMRAGMPLSKLAAPFERVPQELRAIPVSDATRLERATAVWDAVREAESQFGDEGRVLIRASGTEPVVRVMVEHLDAGVARSTTDHLVKIVQTALA